MVKHCVHVYFGVEGFLRKKLIHSEFLTFTEALRGRSSEKGDDKYPIVKDIVMKTLNNIHTEMNKQARRIMEQEKSCESGKTSVVVVIISIFYFF